MGSGVGRLRASTAARPAPTRRAFGLGALTAALAGSGLASAAALPGLGVQLYTLGDLAGDKLAPALAGVAAAGYATTELAGYHGHSAAALRAAHDAAGLRCVSAHVGVRTGDAAAPGLDGDLARVAADMHTLGVAAVVVPGFSSPSGLKANPGEGTADFYVRASRAVSADDWKRRAARLSALTDALGREGLRVGYHNHFGEFFDLGGGATGIELLLAGTPAQTLFELDVGWAVAAGADPVAVLQAHPTRFKMLHVKDMVASSAQGAVLGHRTVAVGGGTTDWRRVLGVATRVGASQWFVELEPPFEQPRLHLLKASIDYLASQGLVSRQTRRAA